MQLSDKDVLSQVFSLKSNNFSGSLPAAWGNSESAFPQLSVLALDNNSIAGTLPDGWVKGWSSLS